MCGIVGYIDFSKKTSSEVLRNMTKSIAHRGPDGDGHFLKENSNYAIGLGHRRLSIIDLSEGASQPMHYGEYVITYNGEVYNFKEIRKNLELLGHQFSSTSDTEVILHSYIEWGEACLHRFIGMFAFAIYHSSKNKLFIARDRAGVKPLFYYVKNNCFIFSSELKALHHHPSFEAKINLSSVQSYMQFGSVPTPHCIFQNVFKLKPGHFMDLDLKDFITVEAKTKRQEKYWSVYDSYNAPKHELSFEEAKEKTKKLLTSACNYRMVSDVPVGVFLSGGFDSTSVVSLLQENRTEKLKTFTISVPDLGLDEAPYAKEIAQHLGTDHTEINCTHREAMDLIQDLPYYYDEPFADSSAIPTTLVSLAARKHVTVALSADAGDEVFAGYNRYDFILRYGKKLNAIPSWIRNGTSSLMSQIPSNSILFARNKYNFHNRYEKLKILLKDPSPENIMLSVSQQFTNDQIQKLLVQAPTFLKTRYTSNQLLESSFSELSYMMAIDYETYLVDDILQKVDRATMSASLEGREPYLDHRIIEWAARLPNYFKYNNGIKKHILREIVYDYIPKHMLDRPKMGFAIPIGEWLKNDLKELVMCHLDGTFIRAQGIFNPMEVEKLLDAFYKKDRKEYDTKIWYLLMFQMWYKRWMV